MTDYLSRSVSDAIVKGGYVTGFMYDKLAAIDPLRAYELLFLDPMFWKALGKAFGNKEVMHCDRYPRCETVQCEYGGYKDPHRMFDEFMSCVWHGTSFNEYFKSLYDRS